MFLRPILPACRTYASTSTAADRLAAKATGARSKRSTWSNLGAVCLLALGMIFSPTAAHAQATAHFAGMQSVLPGSGIPVPVSVAVDTLGNVYVSDANSNSVFEISNGSATQLYGNANIGPLAVDASGNVFAAFNASTPLIEEITAGVHSHVTVGSTSLSLGAATFTFGNIAGIAVDASGNLFVSDRSNPNIHGPGVFEVTPVTPGDYTSATVTQLGLTGGNPFSTTVAGAALDSSGNLFVLDPGNGFVYELAVSDYSTATPLSSITVSSNSKSIALDSSDNIYIADTGNAFIHEFLSTGGYTTSIQLGAGLTNPSGVAVDSNNNLYIANSGASDIVEIQFGAVNVGPVTLTNPTIPASATLTFNFPDSSPITLGTNIVLPAVKPFGALPTAPNEFADAGTGSCTVANSPFDSGDTPNCTVDINFTPAYPGQRIGTVQLQDDSNNILASVDVYGNGIAPQVAFTPGVISAVAGQNGVSCTTAPSCGDGGSPTSAFLSGPTGTAVDAAGDLFIADLQDAVVREVPAGSPAIITVAGNYTACTPGSDPNPPTCTGDGGPATSAQLDAPAAVAVDAAGDLFIADSSAQTIREVSAAGTISTVAGGSAANFTSGQPCPLGPGTATDFLGDGCLATASRLISPFDIVLDASGNFYTADQGAGLIRKVSAATGIITAVAGSIIPATIAATNPCPSNLGDTATDSIGDGCPATDPSVNLGGPIGMAVDPSGNIYIADPANNHIREVSAATGIITIVAGGTTNPFTVGDACPSSPSLHTTDTFGDGCPAIDAELSNPASVRLDAAGNLYIVDQDDSLVRKVDTTGIITTVIGGGSTTVATTPCPVGSGGTAFDIAGDGCAATSAVLGFPSGIAVDQAGNLYLADSVSDTVREVTVGQPAPLAFSLSTAPTPLMSSVGPLFVTLYNSGNTSLTFPDPADNSGVANPLIVQTQDFSLDSGTTNLCNTSNLGGDYLLPAGANCLYAVDFTPQTAGFIADNVSIIDNSLNNESNVEQQIGLSGYGALQTPTFAGDMSFSPAATETFGESPAITVSETLDYTGSTAPTTGDVSFTLNSVSYTATSCNTVSGGVSCSATIPAATINALSPDIYPTTASFSGDSNFNSASDSTGASFTITQQTPTFGTIGFSPSSLAFGDTADSVTISVVVNYVGSTAPTGTFGFVFPVAGANYAATCVPGSGSSLNCSGTITAGSLAVSGSPYAGTISYAGDTNFAAASANSGTFNVIKASQAITSFSGVPPTAIFGGDAIFYTLNSIPGTSTSPVVYSIDPATTAFAFITGLGNDQVAIAAAGTVVVDANQAADANYNAAPQVQQTIIVSQGTPLLDINSSHSDPFYPGQTNATLTLTVDNLNGTANTDGSTITVTDTLAAGLTPVSATGTGWICGVAGQVVTCTGDDIIGGDVTNGVANPGTGASDPNTIAVKVNVGTDDDLTIFPGATVSTSQTVTGGNSAQNTGTDTVNIGQNFFSVNTTVDPSSGTPASCALGSPNACSLRDAVAAAAAVEGNAGTSTIPVSITFDQADPIFTAPQTISLLNGELDLPTTTTIQGATSGSGATLTNLVTIDGTSNGASNIFNLSSNTVTGVVLNNLNLTHATSGGNGGAIRSFGGLTVNECNITNNTAAASGGGIYSEGTLEVDNSTISGNAANAGSGGGLNNQFTGTLTVNYSTITGNTAVGNGGGIDSEGPSVTTTVNSSTITSNTAQGHPGGGGIYTQSALTLNDSIVAGNTSTSGSATALDVKAPSVTGAGNVDTVNSLTPLDPGLSAFGNYGGPTQTFLALPTGTGAAVCAGVNASQPDAPFTTDQRGSLPSSFVSDGVFCVDAGSTQSNYSLSFTTSPSATGNVINTTLTPNPVVQIEESYSGVTPSGLIVAVTPTNTPGVLTGTRFVTTDSSGNAVFTNLQVNAPDANETLTATAPRGGLLLTATSSPFTVTKASQAITNFAGVPATAIFDGEFTLSYTLSSTPGASTSPVVYSIDSSSTPGIATLIGDMLSINGAGTVTVDANQAADANYTAAPQVQQTVVVTRGVPQLTITSTHSDPFYPGQTNAVFHLEIGNSGTGFTDNSPLTFTDTLPAGLTFVSNTGGGWSCNSVSNVVTCNNPSDGIGPGGNDSITLTVNVGPVDNDTIFAGAQLTTTLSISGGGSAPNGNTDLVNIAQDIFTVNTTSDPSGGGTASNCATGNSLTCSLRDAVAAATAVQLSVADNDPGSTVITAINFDGGVFATPQTISLLHGLMALPGNTFVNGATSGSGATLTNLVTIDGSGDGPNDDIFQLQSNTVTGVVLNNLNITGGDFSGGFGGAINSVGGLTINECNFTNNHAGQSGGAIYNSGSLTVNNSTLSGNSSGSGGGGIYNETTGALIVNYSTITGNTAVGGGGGITSANTSGVASINNSTIVGNTSSGGQGGGVDVPGQLQLNNSIVAGNTATPFADLSSGPLSHPGSFFNNASSGTLSINGSLSALGNYGGPTQTFLALPGGSAICAGFAGVLPGGFTADQRGDAMLIVYGGNSCVDAGSTETKYTLTFTTSPNATGNVIASALTPNPAVTLAETTSNSSTPVTGISVTAAFNANPGDLTGTTTATTTAVANTGVATFTNLQSNALDTGETITASVSVGPAGTITAVSSSFTVGQATPSFAVAGLSPAEVLLGSTTPVTISNLLTYPSNASAPDTGSGQVTFTLSSGHAPYVATCSLEAPGTLSCSATVPGTDVAALTLTGNPYTATSSYAGDDNYTAATGTNSNDLTIVTPVLAISSSHSDPFYPGQTNATFTLTIDNFNGTNATDGSQITVTDTLAAGLTPVSAFGTGWSCGINPVTRVVTCTGNDVIGIGFADPNTITVTVNVGNGGPVVPGAQLSTSQTVIGGASAQGTNTDSVNIGQDVFVVNTTVDPATGTPASCATGSVNGCSLRDAIAAATTVQNNANGSTIPTTINFDGTVFNSSNTVAQNTISLSHGSLNVPPTTTIQGATSGSGSTLTNLVTIDGSLNGSNGLFSGFGVGVVLNNLNLVNASSSGNGGAIHNDFGSSLTVHECNLINNTGLSGGAIFNNGTLEVDNSTISANSAQASGGGIYNESAGTLTVNYSTVTQNNANGTGGGIDSENNSVTTTVNTTTITLNAAGNAGGLHAAGPLTLNDSVVAQNNATINSNDVLPDTTFTHNGSVFNSASSLSTSTASGLSALGSYGGPTKTFLALPGGNSICAGVSASQPDIPFTTDQRGSSPSSFIAGTTFCVDAGSTQSLYSLNFTTSPSTNGNLPNVTLTPNPVVQLSEFYSSATPSGITITAALTNNPSFLTGTTTAITDGSGNATFINLQSNAVDANETLTATAPRGAFTLTGQSSTFNVGLASPTVAISPVTSPFGSTSGVSITATSSGSAGSTDGSVVTFGVTGSATGTFSPTTCTIASGTCSVNYVPTGTLAAATYTNDITASFSAAGNYTTGSATSTLTITKVTPVFGTMTFSPAATEPYGTSQAITISDTLTFPTGATPPTATHITYTLNGTGYSPASCTVVTNVATCTATVPAATIAALAVNPNYLVTAAFASDTNYTLATGTAGNFAITKATPTFGTMTFSPAATEPYGTSQAITISDTLTFPLGATPPTAANITYTLNGNNYSPISCSVVTNVATCTATVPAATIAALAVNPNYLVTAAFSSDTNYTLATGTAGNFAITKATLTFGTMTFSPASSEPYGTSQAITISDTLTIPLGAAPPTAGNVTYTLAGTGYFATGCTVVGTVATCTATVPAGSIAGLAVNPSYSVSAAFAPDTNYNAATGTAGTFSITKATPTFGTMTFSPAATEPFGTSQIITISDTLTFPTGVTPPTAANITYTLNGTGYSPVSSCSIVTNVATCTATVPAATIAALAVNPNYIVTAAFATDTNYVAVTGTSGSFAITKATPTFGTMTFSPAATEPYGTSQIITISDTLTFPAGATPPTATNITYTLNGTGYSPASCSIVTNVATCTATVPAATIAALTASGSPYTVTAAFATDTNYVAVTGTSGSFAITKTTPTFGTMTFSPAASEPYGTSQIITISDTLTYSGAVAPTGAVTYTLNGTPYTATCTTAGSPETCSATVPAATIAALAVQGYTVTAGLAADTNYNLATGTSGTFTITKATPVFGTMSFSPASSEPFGTSQIITISDTLTFNSGTAPTATNVTYTLNGTGYSPASCSVVSNVATCTATVPAATIAALTVAGSPYTVTAAFTADTNYVAATGTSGSFAITAIAPATATVSAVSAPAGTTTGVTVTATESGSGGAVTGGVVTFGLSGSATGSFSPSSCTLPVGGSCSVTYIPTGTLAAATYPNDITANFGAVGNYSAAGATNTLTITTVNPTTATVSSVFAIAGSTTPVAVTVNESGGAGPVTNGLVTFSVTGTATGSFSPTSCNLNSSGTCTVNYIPTGSLPASVYTNDIVATFGAVLNYNGTTATNTLTVGSVTPTTSVSTVSSVFGTTTGVTVTANESGTSGVVTGGVVTFGLAGSATGSFSPATCTLPVGGSCSVTYIPTGTLTAGTYANDITASFTATGNYATATAAGTLSINQAGSTVVIAQIVPSTIGSIGVGVSSSFTATVTDGSANSTGSPTGSVNFFDGSTQLNANPIALSSGVATITNVIFTTVATHSITAVYSGDGNFVANTSAPLSESVVVPSFSVSANPNSLTIAQGNSGTASLTFTPVGNYTGTLNLNCTGLPAFTSCQFLPPTITFTGNNVQQTSQLTVFTLNAHAVPGGSSQNLLWFPVAGMLAMLIAIRRRKLARTLRPLLMVAIAALAMTAITGCGSGATFVTPTGNNSVTITASATGTGASGNVNQTAVITIIITQ